MQVKFNSSYNNINNCRINKNYSSKCFASKTPKNINFNGVLVKANQSQTTSSVTAFFKSIKTFFYECVFSKTSPEKLIPQQKNLQNIFQIIKNDIGLLKKYKDILELPQNYIVDTNNNPDLFSKLKVQEYKLKKEVGAETIDKINNLLKHKQQINWDYVLDFSDNSSQKIKQKLNTILETLSVCERLDSKHYNFEKNLYWAKHCNLIINFNSNKIQNGQSFEQLLSDTAFSYNKIFGTTKQNKRGLFRIGTKKCIQTPYDEKHYCEYIEKFNTLTQIARPAPLRGLKLTEIIHSERGGRMFHPVPDDIPIGLKYCENFYNQILPFAKKYKETKSLSINEKINATENIAKIHYILSNLAPFERGSAGIANIITRSLYKSIGLNLPATKKNIALDLEAFYLPMNTYVKQWHSFFELP